MLYPEISDLRGILNTLGLEISVLHGSLCSLVLQLSFSVGCRISGTYVLD